MIESRRQRFERLFNPVARSLRILPGARLGCGSKNNVRLAPKISRLPERNRLLSGCQSTIFRSTLSRCLRQYRDQGGYLFPKPLDKAIRSPPAGQAAACDGENPTNILHFVVKGSS